MLLQRMFKLKSSEMARNASETVNTDVTFYLYQLIYVFFSFKVRSQSFSLALTFDQHNSPDEAEIFDLFSCESQQLVKTQFRCSCFRQSYVPLCSL